MRFPYGCICRKNFFDKTETTDTTIWKPGFKGMTILSFRFLMNFELEEPASQTDQRIQSFSTRLHEYPNLGFKSSKQ